MTRYHATASTSAALPEHTPSTWLGIMDMLAASVLMDLDEVAGDYDRSTVIWFFTKALGWWAEPEDGEPGMWIEGPYYLTGTVEAS